MLWVKTNLDQLERNINCSRKTLIHNFWAFLLNLALAALNGWLCYVQGYIINGIFFGAVLTTLLWIFVLWLMEYSDWKDHKRHYAYFKRINDEKGIEIKEKELSEAIEKYKNLHRELYNSLIKES